LIPWSQKPPGSEKTPPRRQVEKSARICVSLLELRPSKSTVTPLQGAAKNVGLDSMAIFNPPPGGELGRSRAPCLHSISHGPFFIDLTSIRQCADVTTRPMPILGTLGVPITGRGCLRCAVNRRRENWTTRASGDGYRRAAAAPRLWPGLMRCGSPKVRGRLSPCGSQV
jgi:hypothetical protein